MLSQESGGQRARRPTAQNRVEYSILVSQAQNRTTVTVELLMVCFPSMRQRVQWSVSDGVVPKPEKGKKKFSLLASCDEQVKSLYLE